MVEMYKGNTTKLAGHVSQNRLTVRTVQRPTGGCGVAGDLLAKRNAFVWHWLAAGAGLQGNERADQFSH